MWTVIMHAVLVLAVVFTGVPSANAVPSGGLPVVAADSGNVVPVAMDGPRRKKHKTNNRRKTAVWHKTRRGEGQLLGRVEDIDRREGRASNRHVQRRGKPVGRVTARDRQRNSDAFNRFMLGLAGEVLGGGPSAGCGINVSTPNPTGCGTRYTGGGGSNGLRPPYQCIVNGRTITTNTFRAGCWMVRQNNMTIPMAR